MISKPIGQNMYKYIGRSCVLLLATVAFASSARAQVAASPQRISLEEALRRAESNSEQVQIAGAGVTRARGQQIQARSQMLPQLYGSATYTRTLRSEFSRLSAAPDTTNTRPAPQNCGSFTPNPNLPLQERIDSLEHAVDCAVNTNPFAAFSDLPFGRPQSINLGLSLSQNLFTGGRITAQNRIAGAGREAAEIGLRSTRAQLVLDVTQAYYDAALTERLLAISESTLQQAETALQQTQLARQVGNQPEFELLRAQVTRDNLRPVVIQRRSDRDLALMRLKQLLDVPLEQPIELTTPLGEASLSVPVSQLTSLSASGDTTTDVRAPVRQAHAAMRIQENQVRIARSQRFPSLSLTSSYGRVGYPETMFSLPSWNDFRTNWTVGLNVQVPIFVGGRIHGDELVAQANLSEAQARLQQTRELAALDTRSALERLNSAQAAWQASSGTVEQATRAYSIAELRFREGISTQLELTDSRILLQQAQANRALAARDLQVARMRVALIADLPLGTAGSSAAQAGQSGSAAQQQQQTQPQQQVPQQQPSQGSGGVRTTTQASAVGSGIQ